ncbi:MAG TPA: cell division ATP-binding protein FtsE, partial [Candidatus Vogelbacteria bacterium]|nr:cell division ATP-binding protein FtsE [Candidatus Vogelbacteria bacterium]
MIVFDKVTKIYSDNSKALEKVSFEVGHGEFLSIVGQSGAGKSTLLKLILVEDEPSDGQVLFDKVNVHELPRRELPHLRRRIGCIFQDFRLLPDKTAFENISFAMEAAGRSDAEIEADVPHALDLVGLKQKIWSFPREMSGG